MPWCWASGVLIDAAHGGYATDSSLVRDRASDHIGADVETVDGMLSVAMLAFLLAIRMSLNGLK